MCIISQNIIIGGLPNNVNSMVSLPSDMRRLFDDFLKKCQHQTTSQAMPGVTPRGHSGFQPSCACWEVSQALPDTTALWLRVPAERFSENLQFPPVFHFSKTKRVPVRTPENISDARIGIFIVPVLSVSFDRHLPCAPHHREKRYSRGWPDTPWLHCRQPGIL